MERGTAINRLKTVSAVGLVPPIDPGRAVWIALRSRFAINQNPEPLRLAEIKLLRSDYLANWSTSRAVQIC